MGFDPICMVLSDSKPNVIELTGFGNYYLQMIGIYSATGQVAAPVYLPKDYTVPTGFWQKVPNDGRAFSFVVPLKNAEMGLDTVITDPAPVIVKNGSGYVIQETTQSTIYFPVGSNNLAFTFKTMIVRETGNDTKASVGITMDVEVLS